MEKVLVTSNWIALMVCILMDTTICVRWTTRISLKIWKVAAKPKFKENWKNSWKKSWKFMEFKELERVWTFLTTKLTFQGLMCRSWVKKFKGSDFKNYFDVEYFMWIFGKNIVVHFTCVSMYHCSLIELYKVPSLWLYMYAAIWKKTHVQHCKGLSKKLCQLGIDWIIQL